MFILSHLGDFSIFMEACFSERSMKAKILLCQGETDFRTIR